MLWRSDWIASCANGTEIIEVTDQDALDVLRSRRVEQETLDLIDGPSSR
jgi:hypothetical protein